MADISLKDAFDVYQKQSDGVHKLWAYFQVVSLAVLGYTLGTDKSQWGSGTYLFVGLSYLFFAVANQLVIVVSQEELAKTAAAVRSAAKASGPIGEQLTVRTVKTKSIAFFHSAAALIVVGAISAAWFDKCYGPKVCPQLPSAAKPVA